MTKSLQDQMLNMGLVNKQQANQVKKEKSKNKKQQRNTKAPAADSKKLQAQQVQAEKVERDRQLNLQRKEQAEQKSVAAQVKQLIELYCLPDEKEGEAYNFTDKNKIKAVYVSASVRDQIGSGRLAIVKLENKYSIIPAKVANKIQQRNRKVVIVLNDRLHTDNDEDEDDPYAKFQVPDDLMW